MICPKCKSKNDDDALVCSNCGFKLKLRCPYCGEYNPIGAKECLSCSKQLLKLCPSCKAVNFSTAKVCRKCSHPFSVKPEVEKVEENIPDELENAATLAVELINISSIKANVKSKEMAAKIINKFYQIFAKEAKTNELKPLKLSENVLAVSFTKSASFADSVNDALNFAGFIDTKTDEVSELLESKLKLSYKVRYLITSYKPHEKAEIVSSVGLGIVDEVIFDESIHAILKDKVNFAELEDSSGNKFYKIINQDSVENMVPGAEQEPKTKLRKDVLSDLMNRVQMAKDGFVACLNGPTGVGKSHIFSALKMTYEEDNSSIWLFGQCNLLTSDSPLFFFRDVLRNLFDLPAFNIDIETSKKHVYSILTEKLNITDEELINAVFAVVFYDETNLQTSLYENKRKTYFAISAILKNLLSRGDVILQIEDIECIDRFSLDILRALFDEGILKSNLKIFITSNINVDIIQFFASPHINKENSFFADYPLMTKAEIDDTIFKAVGVREELGPNILNNIYENSKGFPVFVEEFLYLLLQLRIIKFESAGANSVTVSADAAQLDFPKTISDIIQVRLTNISNADPDAFRTLYYSSILGYKFLPAVVQNILDIPQDKFEEIIKFLSVNNFIAPFDTYNYTFKNRVIWETVRNLKLSPENIASSTITTMKKLVELTAPDYASVVKNLLSAGLPKHEIMQHIEQATKDAYSCGDDYSYVYHKILLIEAVEVSNLANKNDIILDIKEELVNLTYMSFPDTAIKYADELIAHYESVDVAKTINILGLMSVSFEMTGNYLAELECVDKSLEKIDAKTNKFSVMLLKYSKLSSLLALGRYEELVNIVNNEILPVIRLYEDGKIKDTTKKKKKEVISVKFESKYEMAFAMVLQGSIAAASVIQDLYNDANNIQNAEYILKSQLLFGAMKLVQGQIAEVENILNSTKDLISASRDNQQNTFMWLALKNIAGFFKGEYSSVVNDIYMLSNFAHNLKRFDMEPVLKGLLVRIALKEGSVDFAQNMAYDEYYKCANNKWALGALVNWYMYCDISIFREKYEDALKVAQYALDAAEKTDINNIFFTALLKLKLAEIYAIRSDYDMAKINAKEALQLAEANGYEWIKANAGIVYYDILLKQITVNPSVKNDNVKMLYANLILSESAAKNLQNQELSMQIKKNLEAIQQYAEENKISLD